VADHSIRCAGSGKIIYPTWKAATFANITHQADGVKIYTVYQCPKCRYWHLTTRANKAHTRRMPIGNKHRSKANRR
jgi:hypothetical protein